MPVIILFCTLLHFGHVTFADPQPVPGLIAGDCPGLDVEISDDWLEHEVIAGFRVWQVVFLCGAAVMGVIVVLCCIFRCRVPRTKQEIEADHFRRKMTRIFSSHLDRIPCDKELDFPVLLDTVHELEEEKRRKGIKDVKLTFMEKLRRVFADSKQSTSQVSGSLEEAPEGDEGDPKAKLSPEEAAARDKDTLVALEAAQVDQLAFNILTDHFSILESKIFSAGKKKDKKKKGKGDVGILGGPSFPFIGPPMSDSGASTSTGAGAMGTGDGGTLSRKEREKAKREQKRKEREEKKKEREDKRAERKAAKAKSKSSKTKVSPDDTEEPKASDLDIRTEELKESDDSKENDIVIGKISKEDQKEEEEQEEQDVEETKEPEEDLSKLTPLQRGERKRKLRREQKRVEQAKKAEAQKEKDSLKQEAKEAIKREKEEAKRQLKLEKEAKREAKKKMKDKSGEPPPLLESEQPQDHDDEQARERMSPEFEEILLVVDGDNLHLESEPKVRKDRKKDRKVKEKKPKKVSSKIHPLEEEEEEGLELPPVSEPSPLVPRTKKRTKEKKKPDEFPMLTAVAAAAAASTPITERKERTKDRKIRSKSPSSSKKLSKQEQARRQIEAIERRFAEQLTIDDVDESIYDQLWTTVTSGRPETPTTPTGYHSSSPAFPQDPRDSHSSVHSPLKGGNGDGRRSTRSSPSSLSVKIRSQKSRGSSQESETSLALRGHRSPARRGGTAREIEDQRDPHRSDVFRFERETARLREGEIALDMREPSTIPPISALDYYMYARRPRGSGEEEIGEEREDRIVITVDPAIPSYPVPSHPSEASRDDSEAFQYEQYLRLPGTDLPTYSVISPHYDTHPPEEISRGDGGGGGGEEARTRRLRSSRQYRFPTQITIEEISTEDTDQGLVRTQVGESDSGRGQVEGTSFFQAERPIPEIRVMDRPILDEERSSSLESVHSTSV